MEMKRIYKDTSQQIDTSKPNGQPRRKLDTGRALERFGFESQESFEDGLRKTIAWYSQEATKSS